MIESTKTRKGGASRISQRPNIAVAIIVRGKVVFVLNDIRGPTLALKVGSERDVINWLLSEVSADVVAMKSDAQENTPTK
eukprot:3190089-Pyramimonas_sp.AAC.1